MRIDCLQRNPSLYTCNAYLIRGDWNKLDDCNTLIDVGSDGHVLEELSRISTGFGKKPVEQVLLTHNHFDHASGARAVKKRYGCIVRAAAMQDIVDESLYDGQMIRCGDRDFEILHTPGHSNDSVCIYCAEEKVLFSGDTTLKILLPGGCYSSEYLITLRRLNELEIKLVYPGHGTVLCGDIKAVLKHTLYCVMQSEIVDSFA